VIGDFEVTIFDCILNVHFLNKKFSHCTCLVIKACVMISPSDMVGFILDIIRRISHYVCAVPPGDVTYTQLVVSSFVGYFLFLCLGMYLLVYMLGTSSDIFCFYSWVCTDIKEPPVCLHSCAFFTRTGIHTCIGWLCIIITWSVIAH